MVTDLFQETPIAILSRPVSSGESHIEEEGTSRVLAKLLSLDDVDISESKQKPDAFSADLSKLSYEPKLLPHDNTKKARQGKRRVRRQRCYPPFFHCVPPPTNSMSKQVLPQQVNTNL